MRACNDRMMVTTIVVGWSGKLRDEIRHPGLHTSEPGCFFMLHIGVRKACFVNAYNYFTKTLDKYNNSAHLCSVNKTKRNKFKQDDKHHRNFR